MATPSPATESREMLQKSIAGYCLMPPDDLEAMEVALTGIRRAIDRINTRNWHWLLAYDDIEFLADQQDYPLRGWFKSPRNFDIWNTDGKSLYRIAYKPWKTFLTEHQDMAMAGSPCVYSIANINAFGTLSFDVRPTEGWVAAYPTGRIWYYRKAQYPTSSGQAIDVPSELVGFVQPFAEGFMADRYAVQKAASAYDRAREQWRELVKDDNEVQTDWE